MKEYRMTYVLRLVTLLTILPLGILFLLGGHDPGRDASPSTPVILYALGTSLISLFTIMWIHAAKKRVLLGDNGITVKSLWGSKHIPFDNSTNYYLNELSLEASEAAVGLSAQTGLIGHGGLLGALLTVFAVHAAAKNGESAYNNIQIRVTNAETTLNLNSNISGIEEIRSFLITRDLERHYPDCAARYRRGERVTFGDFSIEKGTLQNGKVTLELAKIDPVVIERKEVLVRETGKKKIAIRYPANKVPYLASFLRLAAEAREIKSAAA